MFDLDRFIADCRAATTDSSPQRVIRELLERVMTDPATVMKTLGEPDAAGVKPIYCGEDVTIYNVVWAPLMTILPHDHRTWAVIGVYTGAEDNVYWRRVGDDAGERRIEAAGARSLRAGDVEPLGRDIVHSVVNPISRLTGAVHVYGGDFGAIARSEWDPETLSERPYDHVKNYRTFAEAEARFAASR
jgi:predicted metal-dependent enzyme (double-stranded beta helix superfamily)